MIRMFGIFLILGAAYVGSLVVGYLLEERAIAVHTAREASHPTPVTTAATFRLGEGRR